MTGETSSWFMESRKGIPPYEEQVREELGFPTGRSQEPTPSVEEPSRWAPSFMGFEDYQEPIRYIALIARILIIPIGIPRGI
jgi:hypothetical protein